MKTLLQYILERQDSVIVDAPKEGEIKPKNVSLKSFMPKDSLNPRIWEDGKLKGEVKSALKKIVKEFLKQNNWLNPAYEDSQVLGSLASYNWSSYSDIDLHVLADFSKLGKQDDVKRQADAAKDAWNREHNHLFIFGFPVELYVQDVDEKNQSMGVWSIDEGEWIREPQPIESEMDEAEIKEKTAKLANRIDSLKEKVDCCDDEDKLQGYLKSASDVWDNIISGRREGLKKEGEWSTENIVFKALRRTKHLQKLRELRHLAFDKIHSI